MALVPKTDVEHDMPIALAYDLAGRHAVSFPCVFPLGLEDRVVLILAPLPPVLTRGIADGIGFVLLAAGVPHAVDLGSIVVNDVWTHHRHFFPRPFRREYRLVALT